MDLLTSAIAERLGELGVSVGEVSGDRDDVDSDLIIEVPASPEPVMALVDVKRRSQPLGPNEAARWRAGHPSFAVLALPSITSGIARRYRALGINYVDSAGNAYLQYPGFHVHVEGRRPLAGSSVGLEPPPASMNPAGLKVVFTLLLKPESLALPYERLAELSGVSKGSVTSTVADLRRRGHVFEDDSARQLTDRQRLAQGWVDGYIRDLRPRLQQLELRGPGPDWWRHNWVSAGEGVLGGGMALANLGAPLRPDRVVLYGEPPWRAARQAARLSRGGDGVRVTLRERFWSPHLRPDDLYVAPILAYADSLADGDPRETEAASLLADSENWEFAR